MFIIFRVVYLNILRRLTYCLSCTNLAEQYLVYIRLLYACELWDNCGIGSSQKLEQLQLEAVRIVIGLLIFTQTEILYIETGWELLSVRRKRRKLQLFFIKKKIMDTGVLDFFNKKLILDYYFCLMSGPVFLFQIFIIAPLPSQGI